MGEIPGSLSIFNSIDWFAEYHSNVVAALKLYFAAGSPYFQSSSSISSARTPEALLSGHLEETDLRSSLAILASVEAAFKQDYEFRCRKRLKDPLSRAFRALHKRAKSRVNLEQDIFEAWGKHTSDAGQYRLIGELRGAFRFRHWLAHGRYWKPKLGRRYDFSVLHPLAETVIHTLPLCGLDEA